MLLTINYYILESGCPCVHLWVWLTDFDFECHCHTFDRKKSSSNQTWHDGASSWPGVSVEKVGFLSSRPNGVKPSKMYWLFFHIALQNFWTFWNQIWCLMIHHHEPECCVTVLDCCPQGQARSQWGFNLPWIYRMSGQYLLNYITFLN